MMGNIILHTAGSFFETGLGIWIFAKVFPKREGFQNRHVAGEVVMYALMLTIVCVNFLNHVPTVVKAGGCAGWILGIVVYRCGIEKQGRIRQAHLRIINGILIGISSVTALSILAWNSWLGYISVGMVVLGNLFIPFFLYRYYQCSLAQAYLYAVLYVVTVSFMKCTYLVYIGGIEQGVTVDAMNRAGMHTYGATLFSFAVSIVILILVKYFSVWKLLRNVFQRHKIRVLFADACMVILLCLFSYLGMDGLTANDVTIVFILAICAIIGFLILIIQTYTNAIEGEKRLLDVRNNAIEQQYTELRRAYEQNRCLIHDEKHMLQYIEECLENGEIQKAKVFTGKCRINVAGKARYSWTGLPTLDFIINMKKRKMDENSIEFHLFAQLEEILLDDADFVVLLGNLFDNAIEAATKCEIGNREIVLSMRNINEMFLLQMKNTSTKAPVKKKERFVTSKEESMSHGWGIESIRHIVSKYGGNINFEYDDTTFQVIIMIDLG